MAGWIFLTIFLIIIASVVIWINKKKVPWYSVVNIVIILAIVVGGVNCVIKVKESSPLEAGFWFFLIIGVLLFLLLWKFWGIQAEYEELKKQEEEKERLEEESREREYRREKQD